MANMKKKWVLTSLLLVFLGVQTPQFAQDTSNDPGKAHRRQLAISLLRTMNSAEATYHIKNGSYATWQTLLPSVPKYFDDFCARNSKPFRPNPSSVAENAPGTFSLHFNDPPEILPGWNLRLNVHSDGQGYDLLLTDMTDERCYTRRIDGNEKLHPSGTRQPSSVSQCTVEGCGYAVLTDENGVIRQSKAIDCEI
jgi:hypothetical protein